MKDFLPYIVSIVSAVISGCASYFVSRKQFKEDLKRLEKQHELDIDKERQMFEMDKEKMKLEHENQLELIKKENEAKVGAEVMKTMFAEALKIPEVQRQISEGVKKESKNHN